MTQFPLQKKENVNANLSNQTVQAWFLQHCKRQMTAAVIFRKDSNHCNLVTIPTRRKFALCFQSGKFPETCLFIRAHYFPSVKKMSPLVAIGLAFCCLSGHKKQQKGKNNRSFENVSVKMVHLRINFYTVGQRKKKAGQHHLLKNWQPPAILEISPLIACTCCGVVYSKIYPTSNAARQQPGPPRRDPAVPAFTASQELGFSSRVTFEWKYK